MVWASPAGAGAVPAGVGAGAVRIVADGVAVGALVELAWVVVLRVDDVVCVGELRRGGELR